MIEPLTPAEFDVLASYARLGDGQAVAAERGTKWHSIRKQLIDAYAKLGVHGAVQAYAKLGWLRVPDQMEPSTSTHGAAYGQRERAAAP